MSDDVPAEAPAERFAVLVTAASAASDAHVCSGSVLGVPRCAGCGAMDYRRDHRSRQVVSAVFAAIADGVRPELRADLLAWLRSDT